MIISSTFTAEPVRLALDYLLREIGIPEEATFTSYDQVFQQLLDPSGAFASNRKGVNVILLRLEDWGGDHDEGAPGDVLERITSNARQFVDALATSVERSTAAHIVCVCPPSKEFVKRTAFGASMDCITQNLVTDLTSMTGVSVLQPLDITRAYGVADFDDPISFRLGKVPYTPEFFAALGAALTRKVHSLRCNPYKVVVLDCDNTIWRGVVGEDGLSGIHLEPPHLELQKFVVAQQKAGMLVCLCSKNNECDVMEVFDKRQDMVLKTEHLVAHRINWSPKSRNLQALSEELSLGLDSFIFLDDDAAICAEVRSSCPEVLTVQLADAESIPGILRNLWAFDRDKMTSEDAKRTELYRGNLERERKRKTAPTFREFLASLELQVDITPLANEDLPRVSQLTLRTNQFNLTTVRRSESEIRQLTNPGGFECLTVRVSDRFGDYGLVGAILYRIKDAVLHVETFLMSCRVLGRGVEHRIISQLGEIALGHSAREVELQFVPTAKNQVAREFLDATLDAFREPAGNGFLYRIPAEQAAAIECTEARPSVASQEEGAAKARISRGASTAQRAAALFRIATELQSASSILERCSPANALPERGNASHDPPRSELEITLAQIWEEVLGKTGISRTADFEEIGGDSLTAVRLFARIEEKLRRSLPLTAIMEAPTIAKLAILLQKDQGSKPTACLVPLQTKGSNPPFYCMHAAGGNVLFYRDLARHLGEDQPFYGFQAYGLDGKNPPHTSVESMAQHYIGEMREFQPEGPYYLGGSSFGGLLAFEMARQLAATGQEVGLLALFDTYGPNYPKYLASTSSLRRRIFRLVQRVQHHWSDLRLLPGEKRLPYIGAKALKARNQWRRKWKRNKNEIARKFHEKTGRPLPQKLEKTQNYISSALKRYRFGGYNGQIMLFRASHQPIGIEPDPAMGWGTVVGTRLRIYEVPGFHGAITVDPHARFLAAKLISCLTEVFHADRNPGIHGGRFALRGVLSLGEPNA